MNKNKNVVGITAAMPDGTGLNIVKEKHPDRYFDVGIAEAHAVTFSAGLATQGIIPVVAIYSTFLQRGFDQIIHDVSLQKLHVVFVLDRAGLVGADGPTHHGVLDLGYLRLIPGMIIMAPKDESELSDMLYTAVEHCNGPVTIRYPRGSALGLPLKDGFEKIEIGKSELLVQGEDVALLALGTMVNYSLKAEELLGYENVNAAVFNMRFAKPLDTNILDEIAARFTKVVTLEDNNLPGGFGSAVSEYFVDKNYKNDILRIGIPDKFVDHGTQQELHQLLEMDPEGISKRVKVFCESKNVKQGVAVL